MAKKKLLIVESPNKINTIKKLLNSSEFEVIASKGHIRDLAKKGKFGLGVDLETFEGYFKDDDKKAAIIKEIKDETKKADVIYLATDPDREGEAIAYHVDQVMVKKGKDIKRITFNEITKPAIEDALKNPRDLDMDLVNSQFARRVIDRIIGFRLSHFTRNKLDSESAGRVQSVALKIVVDREKEIENFEKTVWWTLDASLGNEVDLTLRKIDPDAGLVAGVDYEEGTESSEIKFKTKEKAVELLKQTPQNGYVVYKIDDPQMKKENSREPLKTSSLQQEASTKHGMDPSKTMRIAQELYEGVKVNGKVIGLITYPRTDATKLSNYFAKGALKWIERAFGKEYVGAPKSGKAAKNAQEAHEAIRPTDLNNNPLNLKDQLTADQLKLYSLIWRRTVTSLMSAAVYERQVIRIMNGHLKFYAKSRKMVFDGWRKVDKYSDADFEVHALELDKFSPGTKIKAQEQKITQHETKPPARYTQASLVKELEESGIGRPSTFSSMISVNLTRKYYVKDGKSIVPSKKGRSTVEALEQYFPSIINIQFTNTVENDLDEMAEGKKEHVAALKTFWADFSEKFENVYSQVKRPERKKTGKKCPKCGEDLVFQKGKNGPFIACGTFPKCKYTESVNKTPSKILERECPQCGKPLVERTNKKKQTFIACTGFPTCKYTESSPENNQKPKPKQK